MPPPFVRVVVQKPPASFASRAIQFAATWLCVLGIIAILALLDPQIEREWIWVVGGLIIALIIFEGTQNSGFLSRQQSPSAVEERIVQAIPGIGLQLEKRNNRKLVASPVMIPYELIQDIYVHEHISATMVSSHVLFQILTNTVKQQQPNSGSINPTTRQRKSSEDDDMVRIAPSEQIRLVEAFPGAVLSFEECWKLKNALKELMKSDR